MSDDDLTPAERAEIERVRGVLADPSVWAEPRPDLQERVVAAIAEEAGAGRRLRRIRSSLLAVAAGVGISSAAQTVWCRRARPRHPADRPLRVAAGNAHRGRVVGGVSRGLEARRYCTRAGITTIVIPAH